MTALASVVFGAGNTSGADKAAMPCWRPAVPVAAVPPAGTDNPAMPVLAPLLWRFSSDSPQAPAPSASATLGLTWDTTALAFTVRVRGNSFAESATPDKFWAHDSVEFFLRHPSQEQAWYQLTVSPGVTAAQPEPRFQVAGYGALQGREFKVDLRRAKTADGYELAVRLPWSNLGEVVAAPGLEFGVQVSVNRAPGTDATGLRHLLLHPELGAYAKPERMRRVCLAAAPGPAAPGALVRLAAGADLRPVLEVYAPATLAGATASIRLGGRQVSSARLETGALPDLADAVLPAPACEGKDFAVELDGVVLGDFTAAQLAAVPGQAWQFLADDQIEPENILAALDLNRPALASVRAAAAGGDRPAAMAALLRHFRARTGVWYPAAAMLGAGSANEGGPGNKNLPAASEKAGRQAAIGLAEATLQHKFLARGDMPAMGYGPHDYGPEIDWNTNPYGNLNWPACMHRFNWDQPLAAAFLATGDEKYAAGWFRLAGDWIRKHRPASRNADLHRPKGEQNRFAWGSLQTGVRATRLAGNLELYKNTAACTPETLALILAGIHDTAHHIATRPELTHHNPTIVEAEGLLVTAVVFPEFAAAPVWKRRALDILEETLAIQVTPDGVQGEWGINYHIACTQILHRLQDFLQRNGEAVPASLAATVGKMYNHILANLSPDRQYPMFSDARRPTHNITGALRQGAALLGKQEFAAVLDDDTARFPAWRSAAFPQAGFYYFRSGWERDAVFMAVHCSPPARSSHDQPDNGTFELHAYGRWLMPDSGCYAYSHGTEHDKLRPWFGATRNHQTMTLDGRNAVNAAKHLLWVDTPKLTAAVFENASYPGFVHRRSIFFVDSRFFVLADEAVGTAPGTVALHFQLQPGPATLDAAGRRAFSAVPDGANVLVAAAAGLPLKLEEQEGWISTQFHEREPRPAFSLVHEQAAPCSFATVVFPYKGMEPPAVTVELEPTPTPGAARLALRVVEGGRTWLLERDLETGTATARSLD